MNKLGIAGIWTWEAFSPLQVSDPEKLIALMPGLRQERRRLSLGMLPVKAWNSVTRVLRTNPEFVNGGFHQSVRECERLLSGGQMLWTDTNHNRVVNTGLDLILEEFFRGSGYTAAHYIGLTDGTPTTAAGDTMASHAGWSEVTAYDEAARQAYSPAAAASQSITNTASKAAFTIDTNSTTAGGGFLTTNSTKGGTTGTLVSVEAFSGGDETLNDGATLNVIVQYDLADS